jgi:hypothetical protein
MFPLPKFDEQEQRHSNKEESAPPNYYAKNRKGYVSKSEYLPRTAAEKANVKA